MPKLGVTLVIERREDVGEEECPGVRESPHRNAVLPHSRDHFSGTWVLIGKCQLPGTVLHPDRLLHFRHFPADEPFINARHLGHSLGVGYLHASPSWLAFNGGVAQLARAAES